MMKLSEDQRKAGKTILNWFFSKNRTPYITLGGYAGTGKTALIPKIKERIQEESEEDLEVAFCSYTGRAAQNLKNQLQKANAINYRDKISTIHGLIYDPIENTKGIIIGWKKKPEVEVDLIFIDEASMVDNIIWKDLLSYKIPIIAVGDHGQLPPINGNFNLMKEPQLKLEKIHRQVKGSPIIEVSIFAREKGNIPAKKFGEGVAKHTPGTFEYEEISRNLLENYTNDTLVLCGYNSTRNKINQYVRNALGFYLPNPQVGDRVICLRNNHEKGVYNGMIGTINNIKSLDEKWYQAEINMDELNKPYFGKIFAPQFNSPKPYNFTKNRKEAGEGDLFDFGYALTVHKAQGSQSDRVVMFEERFKQMDERQWRRWLYTGVTRAKKELYVFGKDYQA